MRWQDISKADLNGALGIVKYGHDPIAARNLVEYFYECIHEGKSYDESVLLEYLDHAFGKIVKDGCSADHAFGFKLKRGHYAREDATARNIAATAHIILLMRMNWTWLDAKGEVANLLFPDGKGDKAVEAAYMCYKNALKFTPDEFLRELLPHGTPVISRNMTD